MTRAPALFVGHGSPMNAIEDTPSARGWAEIARAFPRPRAIVVISAHWVTEGVRVTSNARPRTIHDFGRSFPQALFDVQYPAPGDPALAQRIVELLTPFGAQLDESWGLDHGAWSVLRHMYPDADVPIVQVSLDVAARAGGALRHRPRARRAARRQRADPRQRQHRAQPARLLPRLRPNRNLGCTTFDAFIAGAADADHAAVLELRQTTRGVATRRRIGSTSFRSSTPSPRSARASVRTSSTDTTTLASR